MLSITMYTYLSSCCNTHIRKHSYLKSLLVPNGAFLKFGTVLCGSGGKELWRKEVTIKLFTLSTELLQ